MHDPRNAASSLSSLSGTVLAFDFGTRKIGVAIGNTLTGMARPLVTVRAANRDQRIAALRPLVVEWEPVVLVCGRPVHADGTEHRVTALADAFATELRETFDLPVDMVDERYTTELADVERAGRRQGERSTAHDPGRDASAARIMLQSWLDARRSAS